MTLSRAALGGLLLIAAATPALAVDVKVRDESTTISVDGTWKVIGDFCGIKAWHPAVADCALSEDGGAKVRTLTLKDGAKLVEKLTDWNEAEHKYTYTILEGPLPVSDYTSTLSVKEDDDGGAGVRWVGRFKAKGVSDDEAKKVIEGIYDAGIKAIMTAAEGK